MAKQTTMEDYLKKMDFKLLKAQKSTIIKLQAKIEKDKKYTQKEWDVLEGVINFIESIQEIAVDEYGYNERTVFKRSKGDK